MNVEFLITTLVVGKAIDWIFQTQKHAELKSKDMWILFQHSLIYSLWTTNIVVIITNITDIFSIVLICWILLLTHMVIDQRDIVKYIMHFKGIKWEDMDVKYGWIQIELDQILHTLVILVLALVI